MLAMLRKRKFMRFFVLKRQMVDQNQSLIFFFLYSALTTTKGNKSVLSYANRTQEGLPTAAVLRENHKLSLYLARQLTLKNHGATNHGQDDVENDITSSNMCKLWLTCVPLFCFIFVHLSFYQSSVCILLFFMEFFSYISYMFQIEAGFLASTFLDANS